VRAAILVNAELGGANLERTLLACCHDEKRSTDVRGARFDDATRWPDGYIPEGHGAVKSGGP
jgi:hypothetical protein